MIDTPSDRYKLLVGFVKAHLGGSYGWRAEGARRMGVAPSYLAKIDTGKAGEVSGGVIQRAIMGLPIDRSFFYSPETPTELASFLRDESDLQGPDHEVPAMQLLARLDATARVRVLRWALDKTRASVEYPEHTECARCGETDRLYAEDHDPDADAARLRDEDRAAAGGWE